MPEPPRPGLHANHPDEPMNKDKLRELLQERTEVFKTVYGGEVVLYAAEPAPEKRPWRQRKSLLDESFEKALAEEEKRQQQAAQKNKAGKAPEAQSPGDRSALYDADAADMSPS